MSDGQVNVALTANVSGLIAGLQSANQAMSQMARQLQQSLGQGGAQAADGLKKTGDATGQATTGLGALADKLREYRQEEVQQGRATRFFAQEIANLLPLGSEAAAVFGKVAGVLAGGIGIGLVVEGVKVLAELWTEHVRKVEEFRKSMRDLAIDTAQSLSDMTRDFSRFREGLTKPLSPGQTMVRGELDKITKDEQELEKKYRDLIEKRRAAQEALNAEQERQSDPGIKEDAGADLVGMAMKLSALESALSKANKALAEYDARRQALAQRRAGLETEGPKAVSDEQKHYVEESQRARAILAAKYGAEEVRIRAECDQQIAELDKKTNLLGATEIGLRRAQIERNRDEEILRAKEARYQQHFAAMQAAAAVGAAPERQAWLDAEGQLLKLGIEYDQAKRNHHATRMKELREEMDAISASADEKMRLLRLEADAKLSDARESSRAEFTASEGTKGASRGKLEIARYYAGQAGGTTDAEREATGAQIAALEEEYRRRSELYEGNLEEQLRLADEYEKKKQAILNLSRRKDITENAQIAQQMGQVFGAAFGQMATGAQNFGRAMAQMAQQVIRIIADIAIKSITASAAKGGAEAATSQAGIPVIGPVLAISAMAAMFSAIMGMAGNIGSAADGWQLPSSGGPFPAMLHTDEKVLPATISKRFDRLFEAMEGGAAVGRGGNQITVVAWDHRDARRWFQSPEGQEALGAGLATRSRNGA